MTSRTLVLVRHGETLWNREGRYQGQTDVPLSDVGRAQARALRERLQALDAERHLFDPARAALLSSDLLRARETCEIAFGGSHRPIQVDPRLRELGFGAYEGRTRDEIDAAYPGAMAAWSMGDLDAAAPGGETRRAGRARALEAIRAFLAGTPHETVVVVTHGAILRQVLSVAFADDPPRGLDYTNLASHRVRVDGRGAPGGGDAAGLVYVGRL